MDDAVKVIIEGDRAWVNIRAGGSSWNVVGPLPVPEAEDIAMKIRIAIVEAKKYAENKAVNRLYKKIQGLFSLKG